VISKQGLLQRLHITSAWKVFIGKESNRLDEVEVLGLDEDTYSTYEIPWDDIREKLKYFSASELSFETRISIRGVKRLRNGKARPHPINEALIRDAIKIILKNY
jgi:hypothetical protein